MKERLQVQSTKNLGYKYKGSFDALKTIFREEGYRGLYKGYFATLFSYGPFSAIYFGVFEEVSLSLSIKLFFMCGFCFCDIVQETGTQEKGWETRIEFQSKLTLVS